MDEGNPRPEELGAFLRARRDGLTPSALGLADGSGPRRVRGLRREEVAQLALISPDYYARLEQGRLSGASSAVLDAIADALRLTADERTYLFQLAGRENDRASNPRDGVERLHPQLRLLIDNLRDCPAIILGRWQDILGWNALATAVFRDFADVPVAHRNFLRMLFLDPQIRERYVDWPTMARICVGSVRATTEGVVQPRLATLVGELSLSDADFRTWWAERHAVYETRGTKTLTHPEVGEYPLDWQVLRSPDDGQFLMVMTAPPGSHSLDILRRLAKDAEPGRHSSRPAR